MNLPQHLWIVVDPAGNITVPKPPSRELAFAKAAVYDLEYPSLAPHQVICYALTAPLPNLRADTGTSDAVSNPTLPQTTP